MLTGNSLCLGPNVTLKLITPSPSSEPQLYGASCTSGLSRPQDAVPFKVGILPREGQHTEHLQDSSSFESTASALPLLEKSTSLTKAPETPWTDSYVPDIAPLLIVVPPAKPQSSISANINPTNLCRGLQYPSDCEPTDPSPVPVRASIPSIRGPFRKLCMLQKGGFATAWGAEDTSSGRLLCLKVFPKNRLKHHCTEEGLLNELDVYKRIASAKETCPAGKVFLMELEMSFQTRHDICFAMDLMANDLLYYMIRESAYCRANVRRWSAQLALGINALHRMGIIHRDIKAENILIDIRENVRIADFGLCYMHEKPLDRWWRCPSDVKGTIQCMAPEMLYNRNNLHPMKYGITVDWWSFGCVLYELVSRNHQPLFSAEKAIIDYVSWHHRQSDIKLFPAFNELDPSVAGLVAGLLRPLAPVRYGFEDLMTHPWFLNNDVSEFYEAPNRALRRAEWPHMRPNLYKGQTKAAVILTPLTPLPTGPNGRRSKRFLEVDWTNPRSGVIS